MRLGQISQIDSPSGRGPEALALMLSKSPFLAYMDQQSAFEQDATDFNFRPATQNGSIQTRAIGSDMTRRNKTPNDKVYFTQAIVGDAVQLDDTYKRDAKIGKNDIDKWLGKELVRSVSAYALALEAMLINGDPASNQPKGLQRILNGTTDLPGYASTAAQVCIDAANYGSGNYFDLQSLTPSQIKKFNELITLALTEVENPTGILCSRTMAARMTTIANELKIGGSTVDQFGTPVRTYNNIPLIILPNTTITTAEPDNAGSPVNQTTSLYITSPGEMNLSVVSNSGLAWVDYDSQQAKERNLEKWEMGLQWKIENPNAIRRIRNIKV